MSDLTLENLLSALGAASSQHDTATRESGEAQLKSWQDTAGYHAALQTVYLDTSIDQSRRWLSIILLKNSTQSHWRKTAKTHMSDDEKNEIRNRIFNNLSEPNRQLLMQNAMTIAQIARIDFPREWPNLFEHIESVIDEAVSQQDLIKLYNCLYLLNQVLKILASVKFGKSKPAMQEKATDLIRRVSPIYITFITEWAANTYDFDLAKMEVGYLALKVSSRLMYDGHDYINRVEETISFFGTAHEHLKSFLSAYDSPSYDSSSGLLAKYIKQMGKLFIRIYDKQATSFVLVPKSADVLETYISVIMSKASFLHQHDSDKDDDIDAKELYEKVVVQGLELIQGLVKVVDKSPATSVRSRTEQDRLEANQAREYLKSHIFTKPVVSQLMDTILNWYFRLNYSDLESWSSDPETFFVEESEMVVSPSQIRPIAIGLYQTMLMAFKEELTGQVLHFIETTINIKENDLDTILIKDAALQAFENGSGAFGDVCDFGAMFKSVLAPQARIASPDYFRIVRRRLCLLFPEWIYRVTDQDILVEIYKLLAGFLNPSDPLNDLVVQLHTIQSLRFCVDNYEFKAESFVPYIDPVFTAIFSLCDRVKSIEAKNILLNALSVLFEQLGSYIIPYIDGVLKLLPPLWEDSADNYLINGVILQTLTSIIGAAKDKSVACYQMAIPAIRVSVDPASELHVYLLEDALPLWKALVENANEPNDDLLSLTPGLLHLLESSTEELPSELDILKSYILLAPQLILTHDFTSKLFAISAQYCSYMSQDAFSKLAEIVGLISLVSPLASYIRPFFDSGLFTEILKTLFDEGVITMVTVCQILNFFSKMAFENSALFLELIASTGESEKIINLWFEKCNHMGHPRDRKMNGLGLASLAATGDPLLLSRLAELVDLWCQLLDEVNETNGDSEVYYGAFEYTHPGDDELSAEQKRLKELSSKDPVHSMSLKEVIKSTLRTLNSLPKHYHKEFIEPLEPKVLEAINSILNQ